MKELIYTITKRSERLGYGTLFVALFAGSFLLITGWFMVLLSSGY
ncbi:MAG: hypothetical protein WDZ93_00395 [Candidatus Paceibacterota bacterium]